MANSCVKYQDPVPQIAADPPSTKGRAKSREENRNRRRRRRRPARANGTPPRTPPTAMLSSLSDAHPTILRALSSRLGEVRDVSAAWRAAGPDGSGEPALLQALRLVRSECHEWTASDVLRSLASHEAGELLVASDGWAGDGGGALHAAPLARGLPAWSWPAYPRAPWLRHVCPVLESLLSSCYEDWLLAALATTRAVLAALAPMLQLASAQCTAEDLAPPPPLPPEGAAGEEAGGGGDGAGAPSAAAAAAADERAMRHAAATGAASFAKLAAPLHAALSSAAQCPSPGTARAAAQLAADLRGVLLRLQHLTSVDA